MASVWLWVFTPNAVNICLLISNTLVSHLDSICINGLNSRLIPMKRANLLLLFVLIEYLIQLDSKLWLFLLSSRVLWSLFLHYDSLAASMCTWVWRRSALFPKVHIVLKTVLAERISKPVHSDSCAWWKGFYLLSGFFNYLHEHCWSVVVWVVWWVRDVSFLVYTTFSQYFGLHFNYILRHF